MREQAGATAATVGRTVDMGTGATLGACGAGAGVGAGTGSGAGAGAGGSTAVISGSGLGSGSRLLGLWSLLGRARGLPCFGLRAGAGAGAGAGGRFALTGSSADSKNASKSSSKPDIHPRSNRSARSPRCHQQARTRARDARAPALAAARSRGCLRVDHECSESPTRIIIMARKFMPDHGPDLVSNGDSGHCSGIVRTDSDTNIRYSSLRRTEVYIYRIQYASTVGRHHWKAVRSEQPLVSSFIFYSHERSSTTAHTEITADYR